MRITETLSSAGFTDHTSLPSSDIAMGDEFVGPAGVTFGTTGGFAPAAVPPREPTMPSAQRVAASASTRTRPSSLRRRSVTIFSRNGRLTRR